MRVVSYYTDDPPQYAEHHKEFFQQSPDSYVVKYPSLGSWKLNCFLKPFFLLHCLEKYREPLFYADIDSRIKKLPRPDKKYDVLASKLDDDSYFAGSMVIMPSAETLLEDWLSTCIMLDDDRLADQTAFNTVSSKYKIGIIPKNYLAIKDIHEPADAGILHLQASRETRHATTKDSERPPGLRVMLDGSYMMPRSDPRLEEWLKDNATKDAGYDFKWWPRVSASQDARNLWPWFRDKEVTIIGKGPSLDRLTLDEDGGPIICINESVHAVEKLTTGSRLIVAMQQDEDLMETCRPSRGILITNVRHLYSDFARKYHHDGLGLQSTHITVEEAIELCKIWGARSIVFKCFDSCTNGSLDYARSIPYPSYQGGSPRRFREHKERIVSACGKLPYMFV